MARWPSFKHTLIKTWPVTQAVAHCVPTLSCDSCSGSLRAYLVLWLMQCLHGMPGHSGLPAGLQPPRTAVQNGVRSLQQDYLVWLVILNVAIITVLYTFIHNYIHLFSLHKSKHYEKNWTYHNCFCRRRVPIDLEVLKYEADWSWSLLDQVLGIPFRELKQQPFHKRLVSRACNTYWIITQPRQ